MDKNEFDALPADALFGYPELAILTGIPVGSCRNLVHQGKGPIRIKLGRRAKFRKRDVLAWIEAHAEEANPST